MIALLEEEKEDRGLQLKVDNRCSKVEEDRHPEMEDERSLEVEKKRGLHQVAEREKVVATSVCEVSLACPHGGV